MPHLSATQKPRSCALTCGLVANSSLSGCIARLAHAAQRPGELSAVLRFRAKHVGILLALVGLLGLDSERETERDGNSGHS